MGFYLIRLKKLELEKHFQFFQVKILINVQSSNSKKIFKIKI